MFQLLGEDAGALTFFLFTVQLFRVLGVRIALVEVITWTTTDQITIVNDPRGLLDNFRTYISQVSTQHDALMLLT